MVFNIVLPFDVCLRELPFSCNLHILSVDYMKPFFFLFFFFWSELKYSTISGMQKGWLEMLFTVIGYVRAKSCVVGVELFSLIPHMRTE